MSGLVRQTGPVTAALSTEDAKAHLRVTHSDDDSYIAGLCDMARAYLEGRDGTAGIALIDQTWDLYLDCFPADDKPIEFPLWPLKSVSSITYIDANGQEQTLSAESYAVDAVSVPGCIWPAYGECWPVARDVPNAVKVRAACGFGAAASAIPAPLSHAMKLIVSHFYENREPVNIGSIVNEIPMGLRNLIAPFRLRKF